ncbi:MAG: hypothetical protein K8L97_08680, partial [Anaerolineae bacterium]|nr:hypothetical protein [Anaerolineae bacterium]
MQNTDPRPPSPLLWLLLLLLTAGAGFLLVILPYPYSNLLLLGMLLLAGSLLLRRAGYTERQIIEAAARRVIPAAREVVASLANLVTVIVRFHRQPLSHKPSPPVLSDSEPITEKSVPVAVSFAPDSELTTPISVAVFVVMICGALLALFMLPVYPVIGGGIIVGVGV